MAGFPLPPTPRCALFGGVRLPGHCDPTSTSVRGPDYTLCVPCGTTGWVAMPDDHLEFRKKGHLADSRACIVQQHFGCRLRAFMPSARGKGQQGGYRPRGEARNGEYSGTRMGYTSRPFPLLLAFVAAMIVFPAMAFAETVAQGGPTRVSTGVSTGVSTAGMKPGSTFTVHQHYPRRRVVLSTGVLPAPPGVVRGSGPGVPSEPSPTRTTRGPRRWAVC
jgi:hypothetical protein